MPLLNAYASWARNRGPPLISRVHPYAPQGVALGKWAGAVGGADDLA